MDLHACLPALCELYRITPPEPDNQGAFALAFGPVCITFRTADLEPGDSAFVAQTELGAVDGNDEALLREMLTANLAPAAAVHGFLSLDLEGRALLTRRFGDGQAEPEAVAQDIDGFVDTARRWQARLATTPGPQDRSTA